MLDVKIKMYPTHAASKPVAMIPNCAATRHAHFVLDGSGPAYLDPPSLDLLARRATGRPTTTRARRVDLDTLTKEEVASWKPGDTLLLNGKMLTGRDAAHKRIQDMLAKGEKLPVDFTNRVIYYVGPVDPVRDEVVGPAGPTTATRMDKFTEMMLAQTGLIAMIGKAERGPVAIEAIQQAQERLPDGRRRRRLPGRPRRSSRPRWSASPTSAWKRSTSSTCGDMPVTVAVDADGTSVHKTGPEGVAGPRSARSRSRPRDRAVARPEAWRSWCDEAVRRIDADFARSADTHLLRVDIPGLPTARCT